MSEQIGKKQSLTRKPEMTRLMVFASVDVVAVVVVQVGQSLIVREPPGAENWHKREEQAIYFPLFRSCMSWRFLLRPQTPFDAQPSHCVREESREEIKLLVPLRNQCLGRMRHLMGSVSYLCFRLAGRRDGLGVVDEEYPPSHQTPTPTYPLMLTD